MMLNYEAVVSPHSNCMSSFSKARFVTPQTQQVAVDVLSV